MVLWDNLDLLFCVRHGLGHRNVISVRQFRGMKKTVQEQKHHHMYIFRECDNEKTSTCQKVYVGYRLHCEEASTMHLRDVVSRCQCLRCDDDEGPVTLLDARHATIAFFFASATFVFDFVSECVCVSLDVSKSVVQFLGVCVCVVFRFFVSQNPSNSHCLALSYTVSPCL